MELGIVPIIIIGLILFVIILIISNYPLIRLYGIASINNLPITFIEFIMMRLRNNYNEFEFIVESALFIKKAQIDVNIYELESHSHAGGNAKAVAFAFVFAKKEKIDADLKLICMLDLAGKKLDECLIDCVKPVEFNSDTVTFKSKDGRNYNISIKASFLKDIKKILGGADNQSLVNKIFDFIGNKISNSDSKIDPIALEKEIMDENFSNGFASNIKEIKILAKIQDWIQWILLII